MASSCLASKKSLRLPYGLHYLMALMRWLFRRTCIWAQKEILQVLMIAEERKEELHLHPPISHPTVQKHRWTQSNWARKTGRSLTTHLLVVLPLIQCYLQKCSSCRHPLLLLAKLVLIERAVQLPTGIPFHWLTGPSLKPNWYQPLDRNASQKC